MGGRRACRGRVLAALVALAVGGWGAAAAAPPSTFDEERHLLDGFLAADAGAGLDRPGEYAWAGEFFDDFKGSGATAWEVWADELSRGDAAVRRGEGGLSVALPTAAGQRSAGLRTRERLVSVPAVEGSAFHVRLDLDTVESAASAVVLTPLAYESLFNRPQIRLSFSRGEKVGSVALTVDGAFVGRFQVPLMHHYGLGLLVARRRVMALDRFGKVMVGAELPAWAAPGASLYLSLVALAGSELGTGRLVASSVRLRHPLTVRRNSCLAWEDSGAPVLDDDFRSLASSTWTVHTEGSLPAALVVTSPDGIRFSVPEEQGWGRCGVITRSPVVEVPRRSGLFSTVEVVLDTRYTVGARMALVTGPSDDLWNSPHLRLAVERRGLVCEAWLGDDDAVVAQFEVSQEASSLLTLLVGSRGVYALGPDCRLRGAIPLPAWAPPGRKLYLDVFSQAPRPRQATAMGLRRVTVTTNRRLPSVVVAEDEQ